MSAPFFPAPPSVDGLPSMEVDVLALWREADVFHRSMAKDAPRGEYTFYEGPPTANNVPHVGHTLTRTIKDLFPRFRTMQGYRVKRQAGWDTHGLPVEIAIEKELGFTDKSDIETYGVEAFNQKCYDSVLRYEKEWVEASERLGYWLDYKGAYFTFTNTYIESVWWILKQMFDQDMLYEGHKVLPYCPLCGTTHSSHEVAQAYADVKDPSITVAFHVEPGQARRAHDFGKDTWILAWTTTPWTLPSNMGACVHPDYVYAVVESRAHPERQYLIARGMETPVLERVGKESVDLRNEPALITFLGAELEGLKYERLFDFTGTGTDAEGHQDTAGRPERGGNWSVVVDPYVTLDSGTGIVHVAPAFGEDDHRVGKKYGLAMYCAMGADGRFKDHAGELSGLWFKDADEHVLMDLKQRGQLVRSEKYEHSYPHCWRHGTPLYYYATSSWFVRTTRIQGRLLANNQAIGWTPGHIQDGRFGKWLEGVVDWALSRKRYWGTPLPLWRCESCGDISCFGSYEELFAAAGRDLPTDPYDREQWNPHRPYVDDFPVACSCGADKHRVPEVIDCWFDAGAMPFAQGHYPFNEEYRDAVDSGDRFPADFISEAVDQTRGWFYTLHVIATFLKDSPAYKNCVVLGHVLDEDGRKMSKRLGNVVAPDAIIDSFGADAFRWFFYRTNPSLPSRFGPNMVRESIKLFLLPLLNAWSFFTIYAELDGFRPNAQQAPSFGDRAPLDRWILTRLQQTVTAVTEALEGYRIPDAARALEDFVEGLTNWYIRRSRRRFWKAAADADKAAAHFTLHEVLSTLAHLIAPFTPFLAERMYQDLVRPAHPDAAESVHLASWPTADPARVDEAIQVRMEAARRVVTLGHAARNAASIGVRQPLAAATMVSVDEVLVEALHDPATAEIVRDELNVKHIEFAAERAEWVTYTCKPNFRALGRRVGKRMKSLAAAIGAADAAELVAAWERDTQVTVQPADGGEAVMLSGDDLDVRLQQREGTTSSFDEGVLVALDTHITGELATEGLARELINRIQGMRKELDLRYDDRIKVSWTGGPTIAAAMDAHGELVSGEVLAVALERREALDDAPATKLRGEDFAVSLEVAPR